MCLAVAAGLAADPGSGCGRDWLNRCSCDVCKHAKAYKWRRRRARNRARLTPEHAHGISGYIYWHCRCDECTAANRRRVANWRLRSRRRARESAYRARKAQIAAAQAERGWQIYKLVWEQPGLIYIGQTTRMDFRLERHQGEYSDGRPSPVTEAWNKHGPPVVTVLITAWTQHEADRTEQQLIDVWRSSKKYRCLNRRPVRPYQKTARWVDPARPETLPKPGLYGCCLCQKRFTADVMSVDSRRPHGVGNKCRECQRQYCRLKGHLYRWKTQQRYTDAYTLARQLGLQGRYLYGTDLDEYLVEHGHIDERPPGTRKWLRNRPPPPVEIAKPNWCAICRQWLPRDLIVGNANRRTGVSDMCKPCCRFVARLRKCWQDAGRASSRGASAAVREYIDAGGDLDVYGPEMEQVAGRLLQQVTAGE